MNDEPADFSFLRNSAALQITLLGAFGGKNTAGTIWSGDMPTVIGYYDASATTVAAAAASEVPLFGGGIIPQTVGSTLTVIPPYANYGLYAIVCAATVLLPDGSYKCTATQTYYSNENFDSPGETTHQHFALFDLLGDMETYYIGFEDLTDDTGEGHGDYNDVIFKIATGQVGGINPSGGNINLLGPGSLVPEPATFALAGVGLLAFAAYRFSRAAGGL